MSMPFEFGLWSRADVRAHAAGILERLRDGTMPRDGAWPGEKIEVPAAGPSPASSPSPWPARRVRKASAC
jgi:hypothetical protein